MRLWTFLSILLLDFVEVTLSKAVFTVCTAAILSTFLVIGSMALVIVFKPSISPLIFRLVSETRNTASSISATSSLVLSKSSSMISAAIVCSPCSLGHFASCLSALAMGPSSFPVTPSCWPTIGCALDQFADEKRVLGNHLPISFQSKAFVGQFN